MEHARAFACELHQDLPPVSGPGSACYVFALFQAIDHFDHTVMLELHPRGEFADRRHRSFRQTADCQQKLVLLRLQSVLPGLLFAEMQEPPDLAAKFGQSAIFSQSQVQQIYRTTI